MDWLPSIAFWYEFASTYSYLTAMRIEDLAGAAGVSVTWRPILLGPIFAAQGWNSSPFNIYPAKGRYMWRDMERLAAEAGLPLVQPNPFPQNSLLAARLALIGADGGWISEFTKRVFLAEFGHGLDISKPDTLDGILAAMGLDPSGLMARTRNDEGVKTRLKIQTEEAQRQGIFGAPSFTTADGELFWGNDRLEAALAWATRTPPRPAPGR